ncbi:MAG: hypothetical protein LBS44_05975, partial [Deltaproteobacteria bacterium]|nr:hypothetical protein [Deltaproteobacteria bacterium]
MAFTKRRPYNSDRYAQTDDGQNPPKRKPRTHNKLDDYDSADSPHGRVLYKRPGLKPKTDRFNRNSDSPKRFSDSDSSTPHDKGEERGPSSGYRRSQNGSDDYRPKSPSRSFSRPFKSESRYGKEGGSRPYKSESRYGGREEGSRPYKS